MLFRTGFHLFYCPVYLNRVHGQSDNWGKSIKLEGNMVAKETRHTPERFLANSVEGTP